MILQLLRMSGLFSVLVVSLAVVAASGERNPKLFYVSSTTTTLSTTTLCYISSATTTAAVACGRKKRRAILYDANTAKNLEINFDGVTKTAETEDRSVANVVDKFNPGTFYSLEKKLL